MAVSGVLLLLAVLAVGGCGDSSKKPSQVWGVSKFKTELGVADFRIELYSSGTFRASMKMDTGEIVRSGSYVSDTKTSMLHLTYAEGDTLDLKMDGDKRLLSPNEGGPEIVFERMR